MPDCGERKYINSRKCTKLISCGVDNYSLHVANNTGISAANQPPRGLTKIIRSMTTPSMAAIEKNTYGLTFIIYT